MNNFITEIINSNDYNQINYILNNKELTLEEKQLKIENFIFNNWIDNLINKLQNKNTTKLFNSNIGLEILKYSIELLYDIINDYKENKKYSKGKIYFNFIKLVSNNDIISIVLRNIIPIIYSNNNLNEQNITNIFEKIGKEIVNNLCLNAYNLYLKNNKFKLNNELEFKLDSNLNYIDFKNLLIDMILNINIIAKKVGVNTIIDYKDNIYFLIGGDLVEFFSINTDFFKVINKKNNDNKYHRIILPGSILSDILCKQMIYANQKLPMIVKPNNWIIDINNNNILTYGGYLTNLNNKNHYIHKSFKNIGNTTLITKDIINTINYLQSVPFIINKELLNYLIDCINDNLDLDDLLIINLHPETNKLFNLNLKTQRGKIDNEKLIKDILNNNSLFNDNKSHISLAMLLQDYTFYHPLFMDWRGRIYTNSNVLSFQSSELSRSLILFKDGVILNEKGIESLQIYLANCFGLNKKSINDRVQWTIDNHNNIINCKENKFWLQAKEPFLFLSASFEYINFLKDKTGNYISRLPIYIDATCNGLQHLAAMTNDINLAKYVNLLKSNNNDIPNDIYKEMANKVNINIKDLIENNKDGKDFIKLTQLNINRSFIKRGIMTISYGSTVKGIYDQLLEGSSKQFEYIGIKNNKKIYSIIDSDVCSNDIYFNRKEIFKLASIIHNILYLSYPSLKILVNYFIEMNNFINKLNLNIPLMWITPSGLNIEQKYVKTIDKELNFSVLGKRKSITIKKKLDKINSRKQNLGIMPNIVHSMDASNISLLIKNINLNNNILPILTIHDCFATNANYVELLNYHVKLAFLNIYKNNNFVNNYHEDIINHLKKYGVIFNEDNTEVTLNLPYYKNYKIKTIKLPNKPNLNNNLDLENNILFSKYFAH